MKVSVIIPTYNSSKTVIDTLSSVLSQDWNGKQEVIIFDDGSSDGTLKLITEYVESKQSINVSFRIQSSTENLGVARARNFGLSIATGDYICFLDSDDIWDRAKLREQINFMIENNCSLTFGKRVNISGKKTCQDYPEVSITEMLKFNFIPMSSAIVKNRVIGNIRFNERMLKRQDYLFWLELMREEQLTAFYVDDASFIYNDTVKGLSNNKLSLIYWQFMVYNIFFSSPLKGIQYLIKYLFQWLLRR